MHTFKMQRRNALWSSLPTVVAFGACVYAFYRNSLCALLGSYDTGWIIRTGQYILQNGFPQETLFAWSVSGQPYVAYQWLFATLCAALFKVGSLWLVGFGACAATAALIFWVLPSIWRHRGAPLWMAFAALTLVQTPHWFNARPQLLSFFMLAALIAIMEQYRAHRPAKETKWLLAVPPLMVLWVNTHSFWLVGILVLTVYAVVDVMRHKNAPIAMLATMLGAAAAIMLNPYGANLPAYLATFFDGSQYNRIYELLPWLAASDYWWSTLSIPIVAWVLYKGRKQVPYEGLILSATTCGAALAMRRFEPIFIITSWSFVALALAKSRGAVRASQAITVTKPARGRTGPVQPALAKAPPKNKTAFALAAAALIVPIVTWYSQFPTMPAAWMVYTEDTYPLLKIVQEHVGNDRVFVNPVMGSWMLAMNPQQPVFVDSRFDAYPKRFLKIVDQCLEGDSHTLDHLDRIGIQHVVVRDDMGLAHLLISSPSWYVALDDGVASWWVRTSDKSKLDEWGIDNTALPPHIAKATAELRDLREKHLRNIYGQLAGTDRNQIR